MYGGATAQRRLRLLSGECDVGHDGLIIGLGRRWAGAHVRIDHVDQFIHIYHGTELLRSLLPDRSRTYQSRKLRPRPKKKP